MESSVLKHAFESCHPTLLYTLWKGSMWIRDVPFTIVDEAWQCMLAIADVVRKFEVASNIGHRPSMVS